MDNSITMKDNTPYKYYAGVTSQLGFCSIPLRLDSYNRCQFSCGYCFAATRQGFGRDSSLRIANPKSLANRLKRVSQGVIQSALDEFIKARIPFQLGGMSDPFMKMEKDYKVSLEYLKILKDYKYPVVISTKSDLIADEKYINELDPLNSYVRFSVTVVSEQLRSEIDKGCPPLEKIVTAASKLAKYKIPVSFRFQPILPGHENEINRLVDVASECQVKHISAEFLKTPIDANRKFSPSTKNILKYEPVAFYKKQGSQRLGREYILPLSYRAPWLISFAKKAHDNELTIGFADNDLLIHSDGNTCCAASNIYLPTAGFFSANIVHIAKKKGIGDFIYFSELMREWIPEFPISTYLNSKARIKYIQTADGLEWLQYLRKGWEGSWGVYSPEYFDGIEKTKLKDEHGLAIFQRVQSEFEKNLRLSKNSGPT